ncbi:copper-binding protein [Salinicola sp. V024]|jgi:Cu(I)/Ag(I) efflux system protein CusF|uniref:copper-binding protein n=1 Tax=Salinicola sp. V024 TaxID=3459609 RepID=UPI004043BB69
MKKVIRPLLTATTLALATLALPAVASERNTNDAMQGMDMKASSEQAVSEKAQTARATGVVKAIDPQAQKITLAHGPIEALNWPAMQMAFKVADPALLKGIKVGDEVRFELQGANHVVAVLEKAEG